MGIVHINNYVSELQALLGRLPLELIDELVTILMTARMNDRQVFIMGNGGSASTATHFAADLGKNTRWEGLPSFRVMALADNMAVFSAYANDEGYDNVFIQQLANFIRPYDIVIGISASGNSMNVIKAIELANQVKAHTVGLTGFDGGLLGPMVDLHIHVPSSCIEQVEDVHLMIEHMVVKTIKHLNYEDYKWQESSQPVGSGNGHHPEISNPQALEAELFQPGRVQVMLQKLNAVSQAMEQESGSVEVLSKVLSLALEGTGASSGSLLMLDDKGGVSDAALAYEGDVHMQQTGRLTEIAENGLAGWVAANRQPVLVPRTGEDPRWLPRPWERRAGVSRSAVSVPLMMDEQVLGVLTLVHSQAERFTRDDLVFLSALAVIVSAKRTTTIVVDKGQV